MDVVVIGVEYTETGKIGDFEWMLLQPQYKNAIAAPHVRAFCARWNGKNGDSEGNAYELKYVELGYLEAWRKMFANLSDVGKHYYKNGVTHSHLHSS